MPRRCLFHLWSSARMRRIRICYFSSWPQLNVGRFLRLFLAKLYNRDGVEYGPSQTSSPALSRSSQHVSWTVSLGVPMCTYSTGDDDDQEQGCYDTRDAVQDDHGYSCRWRGSQWVLRLVWFVPSIPTGITCPPALDLYEVLHVCGQIADSVQYLTRLLGGSHGVDGEIIHYRLRAFLGIVAVVGDGAVQDNGRDVRLCVGLLEDFLGIVETSVIARVAADICDLVGRDVGDAGEVCVVQVTLDGFGCLLGQGYQVGNLAAVAFGMGKRKRDMSQVDARR